MAKTTGGNGAFALRRCHVALQRLAGLRPAAIWLVLWLALLAAGRSSLLRDPGTLWHLAVGQRIVTTGHLVDHDPFSFTRGGQPWVDGQWLCEIGMTWLMRLGGWDSLLAATSAILAGIFAWLATRLLATGLKLAPSAVLLVLAFLASSHHFHVRPVVITLGLLGITYALLLAVEARRQPLARLVWLVPLFVLWTNMHGGVLAGLGTLGLVAGGWLTAAWLGWPAPLDSRRDALRLVAIVAACGAAVLINPWGPGLPKTWLAVMALPLPQMIQEHAPPQLSQPYTWAALALWGVWLTALLTGRRADIRVSWLMPLVWLVLALQRVRNLPLLAVIAVLALAEILPRTRLAAWLQQHDWLSPPGRAVVGGQGSVVGGRWSVAGLAAARVRRVGVLLLPIAILGLALAVQAGGATLPLIGRHWARLDPARWPVELLPELEKLPQEPGGDRIFNDLALGGFLIEYCPQLKIFIDDRCELYGRDFLLDYERVRTTAPEGIDAWQRQHAFSAALVQRGSPLDAYLAKREAWRCCGRTAGAVLYRMSDTHAPHTCGG